LFKVAEVLRRIDLGTVLLLGQSNRQGGDIGDQYRSAIFTHDDEQARIAKETQERTQPRFRKPIATQIVPAIVFYRAEDYHQQYLEKSGRASCTIPAPANRTSKTASREA